MTRKNNFFEGWSWLKFNNLELALGMALKFYTKHGERVKTKSQKVWRVNSYSWRSYRGKAGGGPFCPLLPLPIWSFVKRRIQLHTSKFSFGYLKIYKKHWTVSSMVFWEQNLKTLRMPYKCQDRSNLPFLVKYFLCDLLVTLI